MTNLRAFLIKSEMTIMLTMFNYTIGRNGGSIFTTIFRRSLFFFATNISPTFRTEISTSMNRNPKDLQTVTKGVYGYKPEN